MKLNSKTSAVITVFLLFFSERFFSVLIGQSGFDSCLKTLFISIVQIALFLLPHPKRAGVKNKTRVSFFNILCSLVFFIALSMCLSFAFPPLKTAENTFGFSRAVLVCTAVPLGEELFFRGAVFSRLKIAGNGVIAVFVSALIFALCHAGFSAFCVSFVLGVFLALYFERTNSFLLPVLCHAVNNFISVLTLGKTVTLYMFFVSFAVCLFFIIFKHRRKRLIYV